jgi:YhfZ C-terminal domain/Helix-turn-helix domain
VTLKVDKTFDPMSSLLEKTGLICREIARDLIPLDVGRKVKTTSEYARLLRAGQGTVQKAFKRLEEMQAMVLESRGHLGTYLAAKDLGRLWAVSGLGIVTGVMPLPDSREYEGIATALAHLFDVANIPLNLLHLNGARRRIEHLKSGADFVVLSRFSAERALAEDPTLRVFLSSVPGSFYDSNSLRVMVEADATDRKGGIRRVGIDETSWDHAAVTRLEFEDAPVEFIQSPYHMIPDLILGRAIDAAVWRTTTRRVQAASEALSFRRLRSEDARRVSEAQSRLALVGTEENGITKSLFSEIVDERRMLEIRNEVIAGERLPLF